MDKLFNTSNDLLHPLFLISVYGCRSSLGRFSYGDVAYMEYHEIVHGEYREARPMPEDVLQEFGMSVANNMSLNYNYHGEIPSNMLYYKIKEKSIHIVWYTKPKKVMLFFTEGLDVPNKEYNIPGLVWRVLRNHLEVYAYKKWKGRDTELYDGPFPNITNGGVCLGTTKVELLGNTFTDIINAWEKGFFLSRFSHDNKRTAIYRSLGDNPYPLDKLEKLSKKVHQLWEGNTL